NPQALGLGEAEGHAASFRFNRRRGAFSWPHTPLFRLSAAARSAIVTKMFPTQNLHVKETVRLLTPRALKAELPISEGSNRTVVTSREAVKEILEQKAPRLLVLAGPCSIHDVPQALAYGNKLNGLRKELAAEMEIIM